MADDCGIQCGDAIRLDSGVLPTRRVRCMGLKAPDTAIIGHFRNFNPSRSFAIVSREKAGGGGSIMRKLPQLAAMPGSRESMGKVITAPLSVEIVAYAITDPSNVILLLRYVSHTPNIPGHRRRCCHHYVHRLRAK